MKTFLGIGFTILMMGSGIAQTSKLTVEFTAPETEDAPSCYDVFIYSKQDTLFASQKNDFEAIHLEALAKGTYFIEVEACENDVNEFQYRYFQAVWIQDQALTTLTVPLGFEQNDLDESGEAIEQKDRMESQFAIGYFDEKWSPEKNTTKYAFSLEQSIYYWNAFSKHVGFLIGGGYHYAYAPIRIQQDSIYPDPIKFKHYHYFSGNLDLKLRFSSKNQQLVDLSASQLFFDIGLKYQLPIYFREITRFDAKTKLVKGYLHQFTDVRAYVNVGTSHVQVFAEYRPLSFVLGSYTELPKFNAGIKFLFHDLD